jgi:hopanoid biosynthesis associated radical SAM protein HpnJ
MKQPLLVSLFSLLAVTALTATESSDFAAAKGLYDAKKPAEARRAFEALLATEPSNADVHYYLGRLALMRDDREAAVRELETAVSLAPGSARDHQALGDAYGYSAMRAGLVSKLGLAMKCLSEFQRAEALDPSDLDTHARLLEYYSRAPWIAGGGSDKALAEAARIKKLDPQRGHEAYAALYLSDGKFDLALTELDEALHTAPNDYVCLYQVGLLAAVSGQHLDRGLASLRLCLKLPAAQGAPSHAAAQWRLGNILEKKGDPEGQARVLKKIARTLMKTLFLQAPSYDGFDGGAGSRYQAKREIRSFWYPTWLAQPAALVADSRLLDAPADGLSVQATLEIARQYDLVIIHTSTPSFPTDALFAQDLKKAKPSALVGMIGAKVAVDPSGSLEATEAIDFVCREEFDFTCKEIADGTPLEQVKGLSYRAPDGSIRHNEARPILEQMDELQFVAPVYKRDLKIENYFVGYLKHPYVSIYTGRGCKSRCTFCLWPQTVGGHRYRTRSVANVLEEVKWIRDNMPEVKEIMFDDDTFTDFTARVEEIALGLGKLGVTWSCNAKANVPYATLKVMKENGLRLLLVGYESGDDQILVNIKKGLLTKTARRFSEDCRKLGIKVHGTFILGLPGETRETIEKTIAYAKEVNPLTIQVSLAAPYPGTALYKEAVENGWLEENKAANLVSAGGVQLAAIGYPHLSRKEIYHQLERFYKKFYFRPSKIWEIVSEMLMSWEMMKRRLREGVEFFRFLRAHEA